MALLAFHEAGGIAGPAQYPEVRTEVRSDATFAVRDGRNVVSEGQRLEDSQTKTLIFNES